MVISSQQTQKNFISNPIKALHTHSHAETTLASSRNVLVFLNLHVVQSVIHVGIQREITSTNGFQLEWNSRTEEGSSHSEESEKEKGKEFHNTVVDLSCFVLISVDEIVCFSGLVVVAVMWIGFGFE
jgi:hypothetical protein